MVGLNITVMAESEWILRRHMLPDAIFSSTLQSQPNKAGLICQSIRAYIRTSSSKLEIRPLSTAIFSAILNGSWQLTIDS